MAADGSREQTIAALVQYLVAERGLSTDQAVGPLFSSGLLDSLELVRLVTAVEERWGLSIPLSDASLENFDTVESIAALVLRRR